MGILRQSGKVLIDQSKGAEAGIESSVDRQARHPPVSVRDPGENNLSVGGNRDSLSRIERTEIHRRQTSEIEYRICRSITIKSRGAKVSV